MTGQSGFFGEGMGTNDVDGGHTTLRSPVIDLTSYEHPIFSYWRWYVNAPAAEPTGHRLVASTNFG